MIMPLRRKAVENGTSANWAKTDNGCQAGWIATVDAEKKTYWNNRLLDPYVCKNYDGRGCCECQDIHIEKYRSWTLLDRWGPANVIIAEKKYNAYTVNGCNSCPPGKRLRHAGELRCSARGRGKSEIGILLPNNQRHHRTLHIQKDVLPCALC